MITLMIVLLLLLVVLFPFPLLYQDNCLETAIETYYEKKVLFLSEQNSKNRPTVVCVITLLLSLLLLLLLPILFLYM